MPLENAYYGAFNFNYLCYAYHFLRSTGIPFTFLGDYEAKNKVLDDYKVVLLAGQKYACASLLKSLEAYVQNGGILVACLRDLRFNENGEPLTAYLTKVFGIRELQAPDQARFHIVLTETFGDLKEGIDSLPVSKESILLMVREDVKVVGKTSRSNKPIIVSSKFGKGEAY